VAQFARLDDGAALAEDELRLKYKRRLYEDEVSYGADAFFFEEGDADLYAKAKFGVLRVDADGDSILVGLADADRNMLKPR
ncbi:MAG: GDYXXLXY domain-containing protein, partial [Dongiaceae bacterium]